MNYLERLSSGDVKTICELIGPRELKQNFRANSNGFNTIKPGFRPNSLSDEMAVSLTAQNVTMRFISKFLNEKIQSMMDKIASEQDKLISQGVPSDGARVVALANSSFSNNMELYFRLEQPVRSSEEIGALKIAVRLVKGMCQNESNSVHASKAADNLEEDALRKELEAQKEYAQKKIQQLQGLLKDVQADVNEKQDNIIQLQAEKKKLEGELNAGQSELAKYHKLEKYSVSQSDIQEQSMYPYCSLCRVYWYDGKMRLKRLSDIENNEVLDKYCEIYPYQKELLDEFIEYLPTVAISQGDLLVPAGIKVDMEDFRKELITSLKLLQEKRNTHPEQFGALPNVPPDKQKTLLDALYEEGIIPTYSFPKNVVSTYITDMSGKLRYEVDRGLDVAISEYAPGRSIVVDKQTYQIGGLFSPGSDRVYGQATTPARAYMDDANYLKPILTCPECGWFGLADERPDVCPFCGNRALEEGRQMLRPWGFAPKNAEAVPDAQLDEEYSSVQPPLYSTLPDAEDIQAIPGCQNIRMASRTNQRIIMVNQGANNKGFMVCPDCGAAMPGDDGKVLNGVQRPYKSKYARAKCNHGNARNVNIGYDFITDMLVLEIKLDEQKMDIHRTDNPWLTRAAQSLAEAFRLAASKELDVEFTELVTGYRIRTNAAGAFVDVYLYDSLSSGAGYAVSVADNIEKLLKQIRELLVSCDCGSACHRCLKHYRNQYVHGLLDRFAALELLEWGTSGKLAESLSVEEQHRLLLPLESILRVSGYTLVALDDGILVKRKGGREKKLVVYPAMWKEPQQEDTVYVSDAYIKYAKPYAVQKILNF